MVAFYFKIRSSITFNTMIIERECCNQKYTFESVKYIEQHKKAFICFDAVIFSVKPLL